MAQPGEPDRPRFLIIDTDWPPAVRKSMDAAVREAFGQYSAGNPEEAESILRAAYEGLVQAQPAGRRFHKGWPLHQLGLWMLERRAVARAREYFTHAFVEDSLSRGDVSPTVWDELAAPAAQTLLYNFSVAGPSLVSLASRLRKAQEEGQLFQTPEAALSRHPLRVPTPTPRDSRAREFVREVADPIPPEWRELGDFGTPMMRRVFIGGSYAHDYVRPALGAMRDQARQCGWDGVLVAEFQNRSGISSRTKSLICLMGCRRAIFELSESGGHQVEFDKLVDFGIRKVLVVFDATTENRLRISSLTRAWFPDLTVDVRGYTGRAELRDIVKSWLGCEETDDDRPSQLAVEVAEDVANQVRRVIRERLEGIG